MVGPSKGGKTSQGKQTHKSPASPFSKRVFMNDFVYTMFGLLSEKFFFFFSDDV